MESSILFRRIHGRIIPIRAGLGKRPGRQALTQAATKVISTPSSSLIARQKINQARKSTLKTNGADLKYVALGHGLQVASGLVSGFHLPGKLGAAASIGASVGLDLLSTAAYTKSVANMKGSRVKRLKEFGKHHAIGTALGYATFGGSLLGNPKTRNQMIAFGKSAATRLKLI